MKKLLKFLGTAMLICSFIIVLIILIINLIIIIKILFFGMTVGSAIPDTIWNEREILKGLSGIKKYYYVWRDLVYIFEIPISIICVIYQIIYFKIIRKRLKVLK